MNWGKPVCTLLTGYKLLYIVLLHILIHLHYRTWGNKYEKMYRRISEEENGSVFLFCVWY